MGLKIKQDNKRFAKTIDKMIDTPTSSSGLRVYSLLTRFWLFLAPSGRYHTMCYGLLSHNLYSIGLTES